MSNGLRSELDGCTVAVNWSTWLSDGLVGPPHADTRTTMSATVRRLRMCRDLSSVGLLRASRDRSGLRTKHPGTKYPGTKYHQNYERGTRHVRGTRASVPNRLDVDAALELLALPAPRAGIFGIEGDGCAGLATDARVADVVQREQRYLVRLRVHPDVLRRPHRKRAHFAERPSRRQTKRLHFGEIRPRRGLLTAQAREPHIVRVERRKERPDLVAGAAVVRARLPETRFRFGSAKIHEVQVPACGELVAIGIGLGEVMYGVEEKDRNGGATLPKHVQDDHVFGLEAARDARPASVAQTLRDHSSGRGHSAVGRRLADHVRISSSAFRTEIGR